MFPRIKVLYRMHETFNLPDFQGRYLKQGTVGAYGSESLPNISGYSGCGYNPNTITATGPFYITADSKTYLVRNNSATTTNKGLMLPTQVQHIRTMQK